MNCSRCGVEIGIHRNDPPGGWEHGNGIVFCHKCEADDLRKLVQDIINTTQCRELYKRITNDRTH